VPIKDSRPNPRRLLRAARLARAKLEAQREAERLDHESASAGRTATTVAKSVVAMNLVVMNLARRSPQGGGAHVVFRGG